MYFWILAIIVICLILGYLIWQSLELKKFEVTEYQIPVEHFKEEMRLAVLADLHGFEYGTDNEKLIQAVRAIEPDYILIAGDLIVSKYPETYEKAYKTLQQLIEIAPIYYSFGNHESRAFEKKLEVSKKFSEYYQKVQELGVHFLQNENVLLTKNEDRLYLGGLEIALSYYEKGREVPMTDDYITSVMGAAGKDAYQILLAHNPMYSQQYVSWGSDLTFCGHNHGGLVRIPGIGSLMSPQLTLFPKYNDGLYEIDNRKVIVSRGLGTHTFHIRICNRAELLNVRLFSNVLEKSNIN